jgi:hypothetical protein
MRLGDVLVGFSYCDKLPEKDNLEEKKFQRLLSVVGWLYHFGPEVKQRLLT